MLFYEEQVFIKCICYCMTNSKKIYESLKGVGVMARIGIRLTDQEKEILAETARQDDLTIS